MTAAQTLGMGYRRLLRLCQKELKETVRDRRTVITLLLMPLLVYPILSMALNRFVLSADSQTVPFIIGVESDQDYERLNQWMSDPGSLPPKSIVNSSRGQLADFQVAMIEQDAAQAVEGNEVDIGVSIETNAGAAPQVTLYAFRGDNRSETARRILAERMQWLSLARARSTARSLDANYQDPVRLEVVDVGEASPPSMLNTIVPLVLVLMTITGAVYPAIDLTAGERERGTMEAVMASPVSRGAVLFSKYVAVVIVALLTALVNLGAMLATLWAAGLMEMLTGSPAIPWIAVSRILGLLVLFSAFYSAVLLSLTSFAKSFKEAQAYLIPVMLVSLAPAMLSLLPGASLNGGLAIVPLINIVLLARDLLSGAVNPAGALAAIASTIAYAAAALMIAARLFGSDAVDRTSARSIGSILRRPQESVAVPSAPAAALMLALLVPIYFVVSNGLVRFLEQFRDELDVETQLLLNAAALIVTFGLIPLISAILERCRLRSTYRFATPSFLSLFGSLLLGTAVWAFAHEAFVIAEAVGIGGLTNEQIDGAKDSIEKMRQASPLLLIAVFAITPAIIEELCFRGYLFSALHAVLSPIRTIGITAILFGLFHVLTGNALLIERFIPTALMGLVIGWVAHRTASVLPGMIIHFVHNGFLMMVLYYQEKLEFLGDGFDNQSHLPISWLAAAAIVTLVGIGMIFLSTESDRQSDAT